MVVDGARDRDYELRKACIGLLSIILSGTELRETAKELLRQKLVQTHEKTLSLSVDLEMDGTEDQKNSLAPLENVQDDEEIVMEKGIVKEERKGEHQKHELSRPKGGKHMSEHVDEKAERFERLWEGMTPRDTTVLKHQIQAIHEATCPTEVPQEEASSIHISSRQSLQPQFLARTSSLPRRTARSTGWRAPGRDQGIGELLILRRL